MKKTEPYRIVPTSFAFPQSPTMDHNRSNSVSPMRQNLFGQLLQDEKKSMITKRLSEKVYFKTISLNMYHVTFIE